MSIARLCPNAWADAGNAIESTHYGPKMLLVGCVGIRGSRMLGGAEATLLRFTIGSDFVEAAKRKTLALQKPLAATRVLQSGMERPHIHLLYPR